MKCKLSVTSIPGAHHLHLDPESSEQVCKAVIEYLKSNLLPEAPEAVAIADTKRSVLRGTLVLAGLLVALVRIGRVSSL